MYDYSARLIRVVDGDTVHLEIDLGLESFRRIKCRLAGINAPEMSTPGGPPAKARLQELLGTGQALVVHTYKDHTEKYGRYLVDIYTPPDRTMTVNARMVAEGHAVEYMVPKP
jgi:micrococcal nuclease